MPPLWSCIFYCLHVSSFLFASRNIQTTTVLYKARQQANSSVCNNGSLFLFEIFECVLGARKSQLIFELSFFCMWHIRLLGFWCCDSFTFVLTTAIGLRWWPIIINAKCEDPYQNNKRLAWTTIVQLDQLDGILKIHYIFLLVSLVKSTHNCSFLLKVSTTLPCFPS